MAVGDIRWLPDGSAEFDLEKPLVGNSGHPETVARLRVPGVRDVLRFLEPEAVIYTQSSSGTSTAFSSNPEAIRGYAAACLTSHAFEVFEASGTLRDALTMKEAVCGFFRVRTEAPNP